MLSTLYLITIVGAIAAGTWQARLIKALRPIRHGRWLALYAVCAATVAYLLAGPWWGMLACVGMAGVFSMWFRTVLNTRRGLLPSYMGLPPTPLDTGRSRYDLLCWRLAHALGCTPVAVALWLETIATGLVALAFIFLHP